MHRRARNRNTANIWRGAALALLTVAVALGRATTATATDVGVRGARLQVSEQASGKTTVDFSSPPNGEPIQKGTATGSDTIRAELVIRHDGHQESFLMPFGAYDGRGGWSNRAKEARFRNRDAPAGISPVQSASVRAERKISLKARGRGDDPVPFPAPGPLASAVVVMVKVDNGAESFRHCTRFPPSECSSRISSSGKQMILECRNGVAEPSCDEAPAARTIGEPVWRDGVLTVPGLDPQPISFDTVDRLAIIEGDIAIGIAPETGSQASSTGARCGAGLQCVQAAPNGPSFRTGKASWPGAIVPYVCDPSANCAMVEQAIAHWRARTSYQFRQRTTEPFFVRFRNQPDTQGNRGCWSHVGRQDWTAGVGQDIQVEPNCGLGGTIHEIGHAIGLWHEQSRPDRDAFIDILWANIKPDFVPQFEVKANARAYGAYDYGSIMHYGPFDAGRPGPGGQPLTTIVAKLPFAIGQRNGLSPLDVAGAQALLEPGGTECVTLPGNAFPVAAAVAPLRMGGWLASVTGLVTPFGQAEWAGDVRDLPLQRPIVGIAGHPGGSGYWLVASDGGVFAFGDAHYHGGMGGQPLNQPIVGMAATSTGNGYWLVAADGGIFSFGDATFFGSTGGQPLNQPIVGMAATKTGRGYWLVARDGGIFSFGDATFHGSMGGRPLNQPVIAMAATDGGAGYWLVARDGGIFSFGDAKYFGSLAGAVPPRSDIIGMSRQGTDAYWIATREGCLHLQQGATWEGDPVPPLPPGKTPTPAPTPIPTPAPSPAPVISWCGNKAGTLFGPFNRCYRKRGPVADVGNFYPLFGSFETTEGTFTFLNGTPYSFAATATDGVVAAFYGGPMVSTIFGGASFGEQRVSSGFGSYLRHGNVNFLSGVFSPSSDWFQDLGPLP